jgi:hypothetical protein
LRIGVHVFDTYTPRFLRGPAQVKSSTPQKKTLSTLPKKAPSTLQKEKLKNTKVEEDGTDALLRAIAMRLTREQEAKSREERRRSELTARYKR